MERLIMLFFLIVLMIFMKWIILLVNNWNLFIYLIGNWKYGLKRLMIYLFNI